MTPGSQIAHYRVAAKLGEGGMGAVYRATDTKLGRDVAIKVLPEAFAADAARMARFEREAQVLASLNHPNIAAIYGIEQGAIVMELVEGEEIKGPVSIDTAIDYARQIAAGLEAAHERGIVHRDLKPANIKVTPEGVVKLLDFGLAKAREESASTVSTANATMSPTMSLAMTQAGMILGTAAYMSPEQARGKPVDRRADIWAYGVILFELLTGRNLYGGGETVTDTLAAVVLKEPDLAALPLETPPRVRRLIERCLRKDPKMRLRDIGEARVLLDEAEPAAAPVAPAPIVRSSPRWWMVVAAALTLALAALAAIHFREAEPQPAEVRFQVPLPEGGSFASGAGGIALSPDGRKLAFAANGKGTGRPLLWVRALDSLEAHALPGTEGAAFPFWSPDSRFLAFSAGGKLVKIEVSGGPPFPLCNWAPNATTAGSWSKDGYLFVGGGPLGIVRVPQAGGEPLPLFKLDTAHHETGQTYPYILPDSRHLLLVRQFGGPLNNAIYLMSVDGKERKRVGGAGRSFTYAPPLENEKVGHLLFTRQETLMAQPVNSRTFDLAGDAFPVAERISSFRSYSHFTVSGSGALAYRSGGASGSRQLMWFDRSGKPPAPVGEAGDFNGVSLSPDGTRAAVVQTDPQSANIDLWLIDLARGIPSRFTFDEAPDQDAVWSPDGSKVAFASGRDGRFSLYVKDSSGAAKEERLQTDSAGGRPTDWSPDGRYLMYLSGSKLWVLADPLDPAKRRASPYLDTPYNTSEGQFSPGPAGGPRWVAYASDESKQGLEIFVQSFPAGAGKFQISKGGGTQPRWGRDGKELFYMAPDGKIMAVDIRTAPQFQAGIAHALFDTHMVNPVAQTVFRYDVSPDGQRFLVNTQRQGEGIGLESMTVVLNWLAGAKR